LENIRKDLPALPELLDSCSDHWGYDDPIYRFYHQSYKVYHLQEMTTKIVSQLQALALGRHMDKWFKAIIKEGTGKQFTTKHNENWLKHTRPIVEAFFHSRYFLEMAVKCGKELEAPPEMMPSGWAALLCLYGLR
jgi:hypothetical protein